MARHSCGSAFGREAFDASGEMRRSRWAVAR